MRLNPFISFNKSSTKFNICPTSVYGTGKEVKTVEDSDQLSKFLVFCLTKLCT